MSTCYRVRRIIYYPIDYAHVDVHLTHTNVLETSVITGDPTVAAVWRRQTYSAAVESLTPEMAYTIMTDTMVSLTKLLSIDGKNPPPTCIQILDNAYAFSRMLHGSKVTSGSVDSFYRGFVPELGSVLHPRQIELIKRCMKSERGEPDKVGACVFPGLVKVSRGPEEQSQNGDDQQTVVRRAQVICQCALSHNANQQVVYRQPALDNNAAYEY
jgi:hypothetical protein